jgi:hypothetical protein
MSFFEYIVKNVGIRRCRGKFVLSTNPDNIFPSTFLELVALEDFNEGIVYRGVRWDTRDHTLENATVEEIWEAMTTPTRLRQFDVKKRCSEGEHRFAVADTVKKFEVQAWPCGAGGSLLMSKFPWEGVKGFDEVAANANVDAISIARLMRMVPGYVRHFYRPPNMHLRHERVNLKRPQVKDHEPVLSELACNGQSAVFKGSESMSWGLGSERFPEGLVSG